MPEKLVPLRNSERNTYRRCRQKWDWSNGRHLEPKARSKALTFGTMVHVALAGWYVPGRERGRHPADTFAEIYDADAEEHGGRGFDQWDEDGDRVDARTLGIAMMNGYVEKYGLEKHIEILRPEMTFQVDIYDRQGNYLATLVGSVDGPARNHNNGRVFLFEHKTAKTVEEVRINSGYGDQGMTYWWALNKWLRFQGLMEEDELVDAVVFNILRKGMPDERPKNAKGHALNKPKKDALVEACAEAGVNSKGTVDVLTDRLLDVGWSEHDIAMLGEPSKSQPKPLFNRQELPLSESELQQYERRIRKEAYEMALVRKGKLPIYKNPTKDCSWDCPFVSACEVHEMGGDYEAVLEFDFKPWDPYADHELEAEHG